MSKATVDAYFTFQYVSINTNVTFAIFSPLKALHSNMFLLIRCTGKTGVNMNLTLHSNMFLLILYFGLHSQ